MSEERKESSTEVSTAERSGKEGTNMSGDKAGRRRAGRPGRRPAKVDVKVKLEKSRQSARECRARKKLRYQYLEDLVNSRENAIYSLREELEMYKQWCIKLDNGHIPLDLLNTLKREDNAAVDGAMGTNTDMEEGFDSPSSQESIISVGIEENMEQLPQTSKTQTSNTNWITEDRKEVTRKPADAKNSNRFNLSFVNHKELNSGSHSSIKQNSCASFQRTDSTTDLSSSTPYPSTSSLTDNASNVKLESETTHRRKTGFQIFQGPVLQDGNNFGLISSNNLSTTTTGNKSIWSSMEFRTRKSTGSFENDFGTNNSSSESNDDMPSTQRKDSVDFKVGSDFRTMNITSTSEQANFGQNQAFLTSTDTSVKRGTSGVNIQTKHRKTLTQNDPYQNQQIVYSAPVSSSDMNVTYSVIKTMSEFGDMHGLCTQSLTKEGTEYDPSGYQVVPDEVHEFLEEFSQGKQMFTPHPEVGRVDHTLENVVPNSLVSDNLNLNRMVQNNVVASSVVPTVSALEPHQCTALNNVSLISDSSIASGSSNVLLAPAAVTTSEYIVPDSSVIPTVIHELD